MTRTDIRFPFALEKMSEAVAYFDEKKVPGLTMLKALKMVYLADRYHLLNYARPVVGGQYACLQNGPVVLEMYDILSEAIAGQEVGAPPTERFSKSVLVKRTPGYKYPLFKKRRRVASDVFSESDLEALDWVIKEYGDKSARQIVDLTHKHAAWVESATIGRSSQIPYSRFFADEPDKHRDALRLAELEQEDRDVTESLASTESIQLV